MKRHNSVLLTILHIIASTSYIRAHVILEIETTTLLPNNGGIINLSMDNTNDPVAALQIDILFDTDCFTVTDVKKTIRSRNMSIFQHSKIESVIRIAITGSEQIDPGTGPIAEIFVDVGDCEGEYLWDLTGSMVANPLGTVITFTEVDGFIAISQGDPLIIVSSSELELGTVWLGQAGIGTLSVINSGNRGCNINIVSEGCAEADPKDFFIGIGSIQNVTVYCHPEEEGPCTGTLIINCFGGSIEVSVTCNGVIHTGTKGDVNEDGMINVLYILDLVELTEPRDIWAADCNGPYFHCDGDGVVNVQDVMKIVNLILQTDQCGTLNTVYINSFESYDDISEWNYLGYFDLVDDPAPEAGTKSLIINGGCVQPTATFELPLQTDDGYYVLSLWGKVDEAAGEIILVKKEEGCKSILYTVIICSSAIYLLIILRLRK